MQFHKSNRFALRLVPAMLLAGVFLFADAGELLADVIYLRNGRTIIGKIVGQTRTVVRIRTNRGTRTISKKRIRRVSYKKAEERALLRRREQARKRREEAARRRAEAARRQKEAAEKRRLEEERRRREAAALAARKKREEAERKKREEKARLAALKRKEELKREQEEERRRKAELARKRKQPTTGPTAMDRLWRSAVLPGWGMLASDRDTMGYTYMGVTLGTFVYALASNSAAAAARADNYSTVESTAALSTSLTGTSERLAANFAVSSGSTATYRSSVETANRAFILFALVYTAQLVHSYFLGPGVMPAFADAKSENPAPVFALELNGDAGAIRGGPGDGLRRDEYRRTRIQMRFTLNF